MTTYNACPGTGLTARDVRTMHTSGLGSKLAHLNGKNAGRCHVCGRTLTLGRGVVITPRHKAGADKE